MVLDPFSREEERDYARLLISRVEYLSSGRGGSLSGQKRGRNNAVQQYQTKAAKRGNIAPPKPRATKNGHKRIDLGAQRHERDSAPTALPDFCR